MSPAESGLVPPQAGWMLLTYGIVLVITGSKIFRPLRQIDPTGLLKCPMCVGWWVGFFLSLPAFGGTSLPTVGLFLPSSSGTGPILCAALANAFSASGWCWVIHVVLTRLGTDKL